MASSYKHGVYVQEQATSLSAPVEGTAGLQVVIGTAPVNMAADPAAAVNKPILAYSKKEAVEALGYSTDFAKYTLCESVSACFDVVGVAPVVLINVLDPAKHSAEYQEAEVQVKDGVAEVNETGLLVKELKVKKDDETELSAGTDFTTAFNEDGTLKIILIPGGKGDEAATLKVSGKKLDPSMITYSDIVGGVDGSTGAETGIEVIRQVYPKLGMTPGILVAPRWSKYPAVTAALQAKTREINGVYSATTIVDIDSGADGAKKYTDVKTTKEKQAANSTNGYGVWPFAKVGDATYSGSALAAAQTAYVDATNDDTPNVSPSNKPIAITAACLEDGTEVLLDQDQANTVNGFGVATWLNVNGFRLWGNNTLAYPGNTDPKDRWFSVKRFLCWAANTFILTYFQKVDNPANPRLIESIVDSENIRGNSFVARGICARYEIVFIEEENPTTALLDGTITFHQYITPYLPAEDIENIIEFDPSALSTLFN